MSIYDPVADMLTRIRNAQAVSKTDVTMSHSKLKLAIAKLLEDEGYILGYQESKSDAGHQELTVKLKYHAGRPVIDRLAKVSKPSLRIYRSKDELPQVDNGLGVVIVSTSKGLMTAYQARHQGLGGEVLCYVS